MHVASGSRYLSSADLAAGFQRLAPSLARVAAVAVTAALIAYASRDGRIARDSAGYMSLVLSLGFAHYAASFVYAKRQIGALGGTPFAWYMLGVLIAMNVGLYLFPKNQEFVLLFYFGIHHVFNEVYLSQRSAGAMFGQLNRLRIAALGLNAALYAAMLARDRNFDAYVDTRFLAAVVLLAAGIFVVELVRAAPQLHRTQLINLVSTEMLSGAVAVAVLGFGLQLQFLDVVLYHFVLWGLFPAMKMLAAPDRTVVGRYLTLNGVLLLAAFALSPWGLRAYPLNGSPFLEAFYLLSYLHIGASFAISDQHPRWIVELFRPTAARAMRNA